MFKYLKYLKIFFCIIAIIFYSSGFNITHAVTVNLTVAAPSGGGSGGGGTGGESGGAPSIGEETAGETVPAPSEEQPSGEEQIAPPVETPPAEEQITREEEQLPQSEEQPAKEEMTIEIPIIGEFTVPPIIQELIGGGGGGGIGASEIILKPLENFVSSTVNLVKETTEFIVQAGLAVIQDITTIIPEPIKEVVQIAKQAVKQVRDNPQVQKVMSEPAVRVGTEAVGAVAVGTAATVATTSLMPFATSAADFASLPVRIISLIFGIFIRKRRRWGVVYDSQTKQPLDPAYVILKDRNGKVIDERITDMTGRFGFLAPPGEYYIEANKTHYKFPSNKILGQSDELYDHLYHGELLKIDNPDAITINVPMDAEGFDWNEMIKQQDKYIKFNYKWEVFKRWFPSVSFIIGFITTGAVWVMHPTAFNKIILISFVVLWFLRQFGLREKIWGLILDKTTKKPIPFAMLKIFFAKMGQQVHSATTDLHGRYYALVEPGKYDVEINEKKMPEGYAILKKETSVDAKYGVLNKDIWVEK